MIERILDVANTVLFWVENVVYVAAVLGYFFIVFLVLYLWMR